MSEHNQIKDRKCNLCGTVVRGKAYKLKKHGRECKQKHEEAAGQAVMAKLAEEMRAAYDESGYIVMADERVMNAEGD